MIAPLATATRGHWCGHIEGSKGMRKVLVAVAAVFALSGCQEPPVSGYVEHKQHSDAYTYVTPVCAMYGQYGCLMWVPLENHMPATWELCLRSDADAKHYGCREVGETVWRRYEVGSHYPEPR